MQRIFSCVAVVVLILGSVGAINSAGPEPIESAEPDSIVTVAERRFESPKVLGKKPVSITLDIPKDMREKIAKRVKEVAKTLEDGKYPGPEFFVSLKDLTFEQPHDSSILVFLNVPDEMLKGDEWKKLDCGSPYCADMISLYAMPSPAESVGGAFTTKVLGYLGAHNQWKGDKLTFTIIRDWGQDPESIRAPAPDKITDMSIKGVEFRFGRLPAAR
jgi:hypothetical protein